MNFFIQELNYSFANEDSFLERAVITAEKSKTALAVCGSGLRGISLINEQLEQLTLIDISSDQLSWAKLRVNTFKLSYEDYIGFWLALNSKEKELLKYLEQIQSDDFAKKFFELNQWSPPLYYGKWEKTFLKLNKVVRFIFGAKRLQKLENCNSLAEQERFFTSHSLRWYIILSIVGNKTLFNRLMYKGQFVKKNITQSYVDFYLSAYKRLLSTKMIKESFFLQLTFWGKITDYKSITPDFQDFSNIKDKLHSLDIRYEKNDILKYATTSQNKYDFISYSDVPSYYNEKVGELYLQKIKPLLNIGGIVVVRYYLRVQSPNLNGYKDITEKYYEEISNEMVQMYHIKVYQLIE